MEEKERKRTIVLQEKDKRKTKVIKERGITLIALVITVIIMLILAGVSISILTSDGGLFEKTQGAAESYKQASKNEADTVQGIINEIDKYLKGGDNDNGGDEPEISIKPIASVVKVGDYVNYDAGTWIQADLNKITTSAGNPTLHSTVNDVTTGNQALPDTQGQFGGFELNQSRNSNSTEYDSSYKPRTAGWRVWSIDGDTVTLISAGHPEAYYHEYRQNAASINILRNRDCSMYENSYAKAGSAKILTGQEAVAWYNKNFNTSYTLVDHFDGGGSTWYHQTFSTANPIDVLENGSYYYLASSSSANSLYYVHPHTDLRFVGANYNFGSRGACPSFFKVRRQNRYK